MATCSRSSLARMESGARADATAVAAANQRGPNDERPRSAGRSIVRRVSPLLLTRAPSVAPGGSRYGFVLLDAPMRASDPLGALAPDEAFDGLERVADALPPGVVPELGILDAHADE